MKATKKLEFIEALKLTPIEKHLSSKNWGDITFLKSYIRINPRYTQNMRYANFYLSNDTPQRFFLRFIKELTVATECYNLMTVHGKKWGHDENNLNCILSKNLVKTWLNTGHKYGGYKLQEVDSPLGRLYEIIDSQGEKKDG